MENDYWITPHAHQEPSYGQLVLGAVSILAFTAALAWACAL